MRIFRPAGRLFLISAGVALAVSEIAQLITILAGAESASWALRARIRINWALPCRLFSKAVAQARPGRPSQRQQPRLPPPLRCRTAAATRTELAADREADRSARSSVFPSGGCDRARLGLFRREIVAAGSIHVMARCADEPWRARPETHAQESFCSKNEPSSFRSMDITDALPSKWMRAFAAGQTNVGSKTACSR